MAAIGGESSDSGKQMAMDMCEVGFLLLDYKTREDVYEINFGPTYSQGK